MREGVIQDLICRHNDPDVGEGPCPYLLRRPGVEVIMAAKKLDLNTRNLRLENF